MQPLTDEMVCWFVARTRFGQELKIRDRLQEAGVQHFIPTTEVIKVYGGRKRKTIKPLIPNLVFLRSNRKDACDLVNFRGLPFKYVIDRLTRTLLRVPDRQMEDFIRVLNDSPEDALLAETVAVGDKVRVIGGNLKGVEGNVLAVQNKTYVVVDLCGLLQARAVVPQAWLLKL